MTSIILENRDFLCLLHKIAEDTLVRGRPDRRVIDVVILVSPGSAWLSQDQLVILDTLFLQPLYGGIPMLLGSSSEETNVVSLFIPFINLRDGVREWTSVLHPLWILIVYMLTNATVNVNDEDLPQSLCSFTA